jgi:CHAT domain-containing protein
MLNRRQLLAALSLFLGAQQGGFAQQTPTDVAELSKPVTDAIAKALASLSTRKFSDAVSVLTKVQKDLGSKLTEDDKRALAVTLADAHFAWGVETQKQAKWQEALSHYQAAFALDKPYRDPDAAADLHNIGVVYSFLNEPSKALEFYNQALPLRRSTKDWAGEARTLNNIGKLHDDLGELDLALASYNQALPLRAAAGDRAGEARTLGNLLALWQAPRFSQRNLAVATFYGKRAGNLYLTLPEGIRALDRGTPKNPALTTANLFRRLAEGLLTLDRAPEALQVLGQVKAEQYQSLFPDERKVLASEPKSLVFTPREQTATARLSAVGETLRLAATELGPLEKKTKRTPDEELQRTQLTQSFAATQASYLKALDDITRELQQPDASQDKVGAVPDVGVIQSLLKGLDSGHAALYSFVGDEALWTLLVTMDTVTVHKSPVKVAALQKQVEQFRWLLQSPNLDPRPAGKQLYELFLAPFETQLGQVKHLLLTLDQSLGVFPFAALYDGTRYALERWNTSFLTPASQATLTRPTATEKTIALGVSEGAVAFPGVAQEVQALGQPALLNGDFTQERWLEVLQQEKRDICHIASPFNLVGSESTWGLLLAEGKQLSLEQLRLLPAEVFTGLSLVTFSTFQTPAQDTEYTRGAIENIAHLVQRKGASAVVANIWSVSDSITSALMVDFYRRWKRNTSKSLALCDAQLAVLRGDIKPTAQLRTATSTRFPTVQAPPYPPIERRLHPFYWSGIVLFGNPR